MLELCEILVSQQEIRIIQLIFHHNYVTYGYILYTVGRGEATSILEIGHAIH